MSFAWDGWNRNHIAKHGVSRAEAEWIVNHCRPPFPRTLGSGKFLVRGQTKAGRYLQVIYTFRSDDQIDYESMDIEDIIALSEADSPSYYIVHARDLTDRERRAYRRECRQ
jgi:uncharacterized DUF497 family protein